MQMIPCPGCGLPRVEEQVGTVPCPVCDAGPTTTHIHATPAAKKLAAPDPTAGLPSDVSQLGQMAARSSGGSVVFGWAIMFALGAGTGIGGLLAWQAAFPPGEPRDSPLDTARNEPEAPTPAKRVTLAPMPHEPRSRPPEPQPQPQPKPNEGANDPKKPPEPKVPVPIAGAEVRDLGNQPEAVHTIAALRRGERVILRGKVKILRIMGMDGGAVLDASGLEAASIYVGGKIDGRSVLKLNAPGGVVTVSGAVVAKSSVEINAPGGSVTFSTLAAHNRPVTLIDAGATVAITAKAVDLRGEINGVDTKVTVDLPGNGSLKVAAIRGIATVEYRVVGGPGTPEVAAGTVSPTANLKKVE